MTDRDMNAESNMTLRDYVRVLFRQKGIILLTVFVVMAIVMLGLTLRTPTYEGSVKILISAEKQVDSLYYKQIENLQDEMSLTQSEIVTSTPVLRMVVDALHLYNKPLDYEYDFASPLKKKLVAMQTKMYLVHTEHLPKVQQFNFRYQRALEDLRANIRVEPVKETNVFIIHVKDFDPVGAAVLANVVSRAYIIFDMQQQLAELKQKYGDKHPMIMQLQDNIDHMKATLNGQRMNSEEALGSASIKVIEEASVPYEPVGAKHKLMALAALFASVFLGIILAFLFEYMDQSIKTPNDVEKILGLPLFGSVPFIRSIRKRVPKRYNKVFQNLSNQLRLMMAVKSFKTVLIAATDIREGASTITANLGQFAAHGESKKVLIVDANFRNPAMHNIFKIGDVPGFVDVLIGSASLTEAIQNVQPSLYVLPAGRTDANPVIFLDSPKTAEILEKMKAHFDLILIDCAELKTTHEACLLAPYVDKTIFVISENQTRRPAALRVLNALREHKASLLGAILNKRTYPIPKFVYERF